MSGSEERSLIGMGLGFVKKVFFCTILKKKMRMDEEHEFLRFINFRNIFLSTTGIVLSSFYEGMPQITGVYGYMVFFPLLLSGMMSFITSVCLAELVSLNPNSGGTYRYVYYTMGELTAFIVGWICIYTCFLEFVDKSIIITTVIDSQLFGSQISNFTFTHLPIGGMDHYFLDILPNVQFENMPMILIITGSMVCGASYRAMFLDIVAFCNLLIIASCMTIFWFYMDLSKFNILGATENFSFFTKGSVKGHLFFMDFEVSTFAGAEAINPTVAIPKGLVEGFHVGFLIYMCSIILYSARPGVTEENDNPVMSIALQKLGLKYFCFLPPMGLVFCYYISARAAIYQGSRLIYTMAKDGLIFPFFGHIHPKLKNPVYTNIFIGTICCVVSIFVGIAPRTLWSIVAMQTMQRIMVLIAYLMTRYQCDPYTLPPEEKETNKKRWILANYPHSVRIPTKTTQSISTMLIFLSVITITSAEIIMLFYIIKNNNKEIILRICFIISLLVAFISIQFLNQQPANDRRHFPYKVRGVPYTPILAISWYILILMLLPSIIWLKIFCWLMIGLLFYFGYACLRSVEYREQQITRSRSTDGGSVVIIEENASTH